MRRAKSSIPDKPLVKLYGRDEKIWKEILESSNKFGFDVDLARQAALGFEEATRIERNFRNRASLFGMLMLVLVAFFFVNSIISIYGISFKIEPGYLTFVAVLVLCATIGSLFCIGFIILFRAREWRMLNLRYKREKSLTGRSVEKELPYPASSLMLAGLIALLAGMLMTGIILYIGLSANYPRGLSP